MSVPLQMVAPGRFGFSGKARLNRALVDALSISKKMCEMCGDIENDLSLSPEGGEYVESASFRGRNVQKLDAHFKSHWKDQYELLH